MNCLISSDTPRNTHTRLHSGEGKGKENWPNLWSTCSVPGSKLRCYDTCLLAQSTRDSTGGEGDVMSSILQGRKMRHSEGKVVHKVTQLESDWTRIWTHIKASALPWCVIHLGFLHQGMIKATWSTLCRKVIVEMSLLTFLCASGIKCNVINTRGICDEFLWEWNAKEIFPPLAAGTCPFSGDENNFIHSFFPLGLLPGSSKSSP